ncbi:MAG: ATP-binding protein [Lachnospiraceae bacterium]|nr:ATP-binding protein [Lachnospiraceae bacterium]
MLLGRSAELEQLNHYYDRKGSQIIVVYGQKNIGKTALIREFSQGKPISFYVVRSCSEREQVYEWSGELSAEGIAVPEYPSFEEIFKALTQEQTGKKIIVIDEFQNMIKAGTSFMKELVSFVHKQVDREPVLVILCSSSVGWVENSMLHRIGEAAYELSGLLKLKELRFKDCMDFFPGFSKRQCIEAFAVLGGVPGLWAHFDDKLSVKENIIKNLLSPASPLYYEGERILTEELRETAVYNTLLASIAGGRHKLNDLYLHTGFSRAKISVYLKSLMELELVEKVFSYDTKGHDNVKKGIYRICNSVVHFYYKFVYPHMSSLKTQAAESFYLSYIEPYFKGHVGEYFKSVCMERMEELNEMQKLPHIYDRAGEWVGKAGNIDIIMQDEEGNTLLALCNYDKPIMRYGDYERLLYLAGKAKLDAGCIFMYSVGLFDEKLNLESKVKKNLTLVSLEDL